ncbi:MAG: hypothetical protein JSS56_01080 [Proteobacteria bacterium]|nr:hypothetical protein [Pseudomonadota bacterium]
METFCCEAFAKPLHVGDGLTGGKNSFIGARENRTFMKSSSFQITLGPRWAAFAQEREGARMLGTVQRGMQIGALALLADGTYAQVNGDVIEPLNTSRVLHAMRKQHAAPPRLARPAAAPVVVVTKKRRRIVQP